MSKSVFVARIKVVRGVETPCDYENHLQSWCALSHLHSVNQPRENIDRYCSQCQLAPGKECTPDGVATACCDAQGMFASTLVQCSKNGGANGYCNKGVCSKYKDCRIKLTSGNDVFKLVQFCGVSESNPCVAKCADSSTNKCYDPTEFGGEELLSLPDGAICTHNGMRGFCLSGSCSPFPTTTTTERRSTTTPKQTNPTLITTKEVPQSTIAVIVTTTTATKRTSTTTTKPTSTKANDMSQSTTPVPVATGSTYLLRMINLCRAPRGTYHHR